MPNGHDYSKRKYGRHSYAAEGTSNCKHGCGCQLGPNTSGGPVGLDPLMSGECPNNPIGEPRLESKGDYKLVVSRRIQNLESRAIAAEALVAAVKPGERQLAKDLAEARRELAQRREQLRRIHDMSASH